MKPEDWNELRNLVRYDARQRIRERSACEGKHRFNTFTEAQRTMRRELRRVARPYHCTDCGGFHIGGLVNGRRHRVAQERFA